MTNDLAGMNMEIKILNEQELMAKTKEKQYSYLCKDCGWKKDSIGTEDIQHHCPECYSNNIVKITKEQVMISASMNENPLDVNQFKCMKCGKGLGTSTMVGAPEKCSNCGSKDSLWRAVIVTKRGKVKNPEWIKFNPDTNQHNKRISHKIDADIKEKISDILNAVEKNLKSSNKIMEDKPMEIKTFVVKCTNNKCQFQFDTTHSPTNQMNAVRYSHCQRCGAQTTYTEKQPQENISRFDRN